MNVLGHVRMGPPTHNAGSEMMLHAIMRDLAGRGHGSKILVALGTDRHYDGVDVHSFAGMQASHATPLKSRLHRWADVVVTHLTFTRDATKHARAAHRPIVHLVHNHTQLASHAVTPATCQLAVFNSQWLTDKVAWSGPQIIVRPPVLPADYATTPGDRVTLVNLCDNKGARTFHAIAEAMPATGFLGVLGGYGLQLLRPDLTNIDIAEHTANMADDVYSRTRVLLMPSEYESWGRCAIEAYASGIPVIAHPTPGLVEALGPAGIFADRNDPTAWVAQLERLDRPDEWAEASAAASARSAELAEQTVADLDELAEHLERLAS